MHGGIFWGGRSTIHQSSDEQYGKQHGQPDPNQEMFAA
jgi:hypothetical protein